MKLKAKEIARKIPAEVKETVKKLTEAGAQVYIVGGSIRDLLLKKPVSDFDLATDLPPAKVLEIFPRAVPTGIKFGTVTVIGEKGKYEITTFRKDGHYVDSRHPEEVRFARKLDDDLARRDFTVNALAYDLERQEMTDLFQGLEDLKAKKIRAVGEPKERFEEDALRTLRAVRFACQLGFEIEAQTALAIKETAALVKNISVERIREEINKILASPQPDYGLELLRLIGLLEMLLPELLEGLGVEQNKFHTKDVYFHGLAVLRAAPEHLRWAALLHDIGKPKCKTADGKFYNHQIVGKQMAEAIMRRLKFSNKDLERNGRLIEQHMFYYTTDWSDAAVRRFVKRVGVDLLEDLFALRRADCQDAADKKDDGGVEPLKKRIAKIKADSAALEVTDLAVNGHDIIALGVPEGVKVGQILQKLLQSVIKDPRRNQKEILLAEAQKILSESR